MVLDTYRVLGPVGVVVIVGLVAFVLARRLSFRSAMWVRGALFAAAALFLIVDGGAMGALSKETLVGVSLLGSFLYTPFALLWALCAPDPTARLRLGLIDASVLTLLVTTAIAAWPIRLMHLAAFDELRHVILLTAACAAANLALCLAVLAARSRAARVLLSSLMTACWLVLVAVAGSAMDSLERAVSLAPALLVNGITWTLRHDAAVLARLQTDYDPDVASDALGDRLDREVRSRVSV
jgi:hypothetical protein